MHGLRREAAEEAEKIERRRRKTAEAQAMHAARQAAAEL